MRRVLLLFLAINLFLFANIDDEIEAIQKAKVSEKFKLMNAFKKKIIKMKAKERLKALKKLQLATKNKKTSKAFLLLQKRMRQKAKKEEHKNAQIEEEILLNKENISNEIVEYSEVIYEE